MKTYLQTRFSYQNFVSYNKQASNDFLKKFKIKLFYKISLKEKEIYREQFFLHCVGIVQYKLMQLQYNDTNAKSEIVNFASQIGGEGSMGCH